MRVLLGPRARPGRMPLACSPIRSVGGYGSARFYTNASATTEDYAVLTALPTSFGSGEFTVEFWIRLDNSISAGTGVNNWWNGSATRYSAADWWYRGNFLIDGHNNNNFANGTFSVQVYDSGRLRWLFGDASPNIPSGGLWAPQGGPQLLDGAWHKVSLVRRWSGASSADLELWIDGVLRDTQTSDVRTNMWSNWWQSWTGYPAGQEGWFFGAEKQAALNQTPDTYEEFWGWLTELRLWDIARSTADLSAYTTNPTGAEGNLVGWYRFADLDASNRWYDERNAARYIQMTPRAVGPAWVTDRPSGV